MGWKLKDSVVYDACKSNTKLSVFHVWIGVFYSFNQIIRFSYIRYWSKVGILYNDL